MRVLERIRLVVSGAAVLGLIAAALGTEAQDSLKITDDDGESVSIITWDIGKVKAGDTARRTFHVENMRGTKAIAVRQRTSCRCLSTVAPLGEIAPRESGEFTLELDTTGLKGKRSFRYFCAMDDQPPERILSVSVSVDVERNMEGAVFELPERTCDFGIVKKESKYERVMTVRNAGKATLEMTSARASCGGCIDVTASTRSVAPGGESDLTIKLDTGGQRGYIRQTLYLETNDPNEPVVQVEIAAVMACAWSQVKTLDFGAISGDADVKKATLVLVSGYPAGAVAEVNCERQEVRALCQACQIDSTAAKTADKAFVVEALLNAKNLMPGPFATDLEIATNVPGYELLRVGVLAHVVGIVGVRPARVFFGAWSGSDTIERECQARLPEGLAGRIEDLQLRSDRPEVSASVTNIDGEGRSGRIKLILKAAESKMGPGFVGGQVQGFLGDKSVLSIPYGVLVEDLPDGQSDAEP